MSELVMDRRIVWNCMRIKEVDEAKSQILKYRKLGYEILLSDGRPMTRFSSSLEEVIVRARAVIGRHVMKILCDKGDDRIVWDKDNGDDAKKAKHKFLELIEKGYKAFSVDQNGKKNKKIEEFDVDAEEILMIPPTSKG